MSNPVRAKKHKKLPQDPSQNHHSPLAASRESIMGEAKANLVHPNPALHANDQRQNPPSQPKTFSRYNLASLVINLFLAIGTFLLWNEAIHQSDAAKNAANAAIKAGSISERTLELSQRHFIIQNRPYVGFAGATLDTFEVGKRIWITVQLQNYGKTPAIGLKTEHQLAWYSTPNITKFPYTTSLETPTTYTLQAGTSQTISIYSGLQLSPSQFQQVKDGKIFIFVYGESTYRDLFGGTIVTHFCKRTDFRIAKFADNAMYNDDRYIPSHVNISE